MLEVERDAPFPDVEAVEHRRAFEAVRVVGTERVHPQEVGPAARLDAQHRRAVLHEVTGRDRARRSRSELDDVRAVPRRRPFAVLGRGRRVRRFPTQRDKAGGADRRRRTAGARRRDLAVTARDDHGTSEGSARLPPGRRTSARRLGTGVDLAELHGASMRFVSRAISYSSRIVWRAKYSPTGCDGFELVVGRGRRRELGPVTPGERTGVDAVLLRDQAGERGEARDALCRRGTRTRPSRP